MVRRVVTVKSITLTADKPSISVGATSTITSTVLPDNATDKTVLLSVDDPAIATLTGNTLTGISAGVVTVIGTDTTKQVTGTVKVTITKTE